LYGFSGYGTNSYATSRIAGTGTIVKLATTVIRGFYNVVRIISLQ
jgi:hypothetical protein